MLPFQTRLIQTQTVLLLSNEHGSQVKDQGRRQCCRNKHKNFPYRPTRDVSLLSGHASYLCRQFIGIQARSSLKLAVDNEALNFLMEYEVVWDNRPADGQIALQPKSTKIVSDFSL